jgi:hypothetical protein
MISRGKAFPLASTEDGFGRPSSACARCRAFSERMSRCPRSICPMPVYIGSSVTELLGERARQKPGICDVSLGSDRASIKTSSPNCLASAVTSGVASSSRLSFARSHQSPPQCAPDETVRTRCQHAHARAPFFMIFRPNRESRVWKPHLGWTLSIRVAY